MSVTTIKRTSICLTQEGKRELDYLSKYFGENPSQVMSRALQMLYYSLRFVPNPDDI